MDKPILVWDVSGNAAFLSIQSSENMKFPMVEVVKGTEETSIIFLTLRSFISDEIDSIKISNKQVFLDLDIDDRILDRFKGVGLTIPSISTTDFLKG